MALPKDIADREYVSYQEGENNGAVSTMKIVNPGYHTNSAGSVFDGTPAAGGTTEVVGTNSGSAFFVEQVTLSCKLAEEIYFEDSTGTPNVIVPNLHLPGSVLVVYNPRPFVKMEEGVALNMVSSVEGSISVRAGGHWEEV